MSRQSEWQGSALHARLSACMYPSVLGHATIAAGQIWPLRPTHTISNGYIIDLVLWVVGVGNLRRPVVILRAGLPFLLLK